MSSPGSKRHGVELALRHWHSGVSHKQIYYIIIYIYYVLMGTLYYIVYILTAIDTALTPPSNTKYHIILIQVKFLVKVLVIICVVNGACRANSDDL